MELRKGDKVGRSSRIQKTEPKGKAVKKPVTKQRKENNKAERPKETPADDVSKMFPNFVALNQEERVAFFEALTAARRNVEKSGGEAGECFGTPHDEYLKYFGEESEGGYSSGSFLSLREGADSDYFNESEKGEESWHTESTSTIPLQQWKECESFLKQDAEKIVGMYLSKKTRQKQREEEMESLRQSQASWVNCQCQKGPSLPLHLGPTPKFDALNSREREIFFNVLKEAHDKIVGGNPQQAKDIMPVETIMNKYQEEGDTPYTTFYDDLESLKPLPREGNKNLRVKLTLASVDNERLAEAPRPEAEEKKEPHLSRSIPVSRKPPQTDLGDFVRPSPRLSVSGTDTEKEKTKADFETKPIKEEEEEPEMIVEQKKSEEKKPEETKPEETKPEEKEPETVVEEKKPEEKEPETIVEQKKPEEKEPERKVEHKKPEKKVEDNEDCVDDEESAEDLIKFGHRSSDDLHKHQRQKKKVEKLNRDKDNENDKDSFDWDELEEKGRAEEMKKTKRAVEKRRKKEEKERREKQKEEERERMYEEAERREREKEEERERKEKEKIRREHEKQEEKRRKKKKREEEGRKLTGQGSHTNEKDLQEELKGKKKFDDSSLVELIEYVPKVPIKEKSIIKKAGWPPVRRGQKKNRESSPVTAKKIEEMRRELGVDEGNQTEDIPLADEVSEKKEKEEKKESVVSGVVLSKEKERFVEEVEGEDTSEEDESEKTQSESTSYCESFKSKKSSEKGSMDVEEGETTVMQEMEKLPKLQNGEKIGDVDTKRDVEKKLKKAAVTEDGESLGQKKNPPQILVEVAEDKKKNLASNDLRHYTTVANAQSNESIPKYKSGKVVLVDDDVIDKVRTLIQDLELKAKAEDTFLGNEYLKLLLGYIDYLSGVMDSLLKGRNKKPHGKDKWVQTALMSLEHRLKFKDKGKTSMEAVSVLPRSISEQEMKLPPGVDRINVPDSRPTKSEENPASPTRSLDESQQKEVDFSDSDSSSSIGDVYNAPMAVREKRPPYTRIRLLQDMLKDRAEFVRGSVDELTIIHKPQEEVVPTLEKRVVVELKEDEEEIAEKVNTARFFKFFYRCCTCGKKDVQDENVILDNLNGEAVKVDLTQQKKRDATSATLNESTMEVLKAAERKRIIQQHWRSSA